MKTIIAVIFLVFTIIIGMSVIEQNFQIPDNNTSNVVSNNNEESSKIEEEQVKVILTGEVIKPGTYTIEKHQCLEAALQLAGGTTNNADFSCFNYFYVISEDIAIYIAPKTQEEKISINTASISEIVQLEGIGPTLGNAIIEYREMYGEFLCLEDLMKVKGIGKKLFENNKNKICL